MTRANQEMVLIFPLIAKYHLALARLTFLQIDKIAREESTLLAHFLSSLPSLRSSERHELALKPLRERHRLSLSTCVTTLRRSTYIYSFSLDFGISPSLPLSLSLSPNTRFVRMVSAITDGGAAMARRDPEKRLGLPTLELNNLSFTYPGIDGHPPRGSKPLIQDLSLQLHSGDRCLLVGSNGAGEIARIDSCLLIVRLVVRFRWKSYDLAEG